MNEYYRDEQKFWDSKGNIDYRSLSEFDQKRIAEWIDWKGHGRVLDVGGGSGMASRLLNHVPGVECVCVDISYNMLIHSKTLAVQADALNLPFKDSCFDLVVAAAFFHHLPGQEKSLLSEINRVLIPGGSIVGYDPSLLCLQNVIFMTDTVFRLRSFSPDEKPVDPKMLAKCTASTGFENFIYHLFSFKNSQLTFFEFIQRYLLSPIAKGPLAPLLERWFFWQATKKVV
ncbi:MAG: class I SAM-dependent methyltransferase [Gammaproteobacteria bacterium]|nr:class I SAM-dependent methyltransferase [Gammaproteobacteria bacterium]